MRRDATHALVFGDLNLSRCLSERGIPVSIIACDPNEPALRSRHAEQSFVIAPPDDPKRAVADLEAIA